MKDAWSWPTGERKSKRKTTSGANKARCGIKKCGKAKKKPRKPGKSNKSNKWRKYSQMRQR